MSEHKKVTWIHTIGNMIGRYLERLSNIFKNSDSLKKKDHLPEVNSLPEVPEYKFFTITDREFFGLGTYFKILEDRGRIVTVADPEELKGTEFNKHLKIRIAAGVDIYIGMNEEDYQQALTIGDPWKYFHTSNHYIRRNLYSYLDETTEKIY